MSFARIQEAPASDSSLFNSYGQSGAYGAAPVSGLQATNFQPVEDMPSPSPEPVVETLDLRLNMGLILCFCAVEAVFGMICGSHVLMIDFYHRLGTLFALVYTHESVQSVSEVASVQGHFVPRSSLPAIHACTDPPAQERQIQAAMMELHGSDQRRRLLAAVLIGCYLLSVAFIQAMSSITSMYGGAPALTTNHGYILVIGLLCLLLDVIHWKYGVEVILNPSGEAGCGLQLITMIYGSCFVVFGEGFIGMMFVDSGYVSPMVGLLYTAAIAWFNTDAVTSGAGALQMMDYAKPRFVTGRSTQF